MKKLILCLLPLMTTYSFSCTTIVVGKKASATGQIMFGRNSDTNPASRAKHLKLYKPTSQTAGFIALPYYNTEDQDGMLQVATNEFGVAISATETITSNAQALAADPYITTGVQEFNVTKPVMEQAATAKEAVKLIGARIAKEGAAEGFGIVLADKNEAWYLETASGTRWVAVRVPDDAYFVSANQGRIQEVGLDENGKFADGYMGSSDLISFAKQHGFYKEYNGRFDFRLTYQRINNIQTGGMDNDVNYNYLRIATLQNKFSSTSTENFKNGEFPTFLKPAHKLTLSDVEAGLSDYYQNTGNDPYTNPQASANYRPISVFRSSNSHVTVVRDNADQKIANVEYIALGMPNLSIYLPFYYGINEVPHAYQIGNGNADDSSAFWQFRKLQALVFTDFAHNEPIVRKRFKMLNDLILADQATMESKYKTSGNDQLIQDFVNRSTELAIQEAKKLTLELENKYKIAHPDEKVEFNNSYYDQLTLDIYNKYRFPGF